MYNYLQYVQSLCSPYTEQTASGLPNPTPMEGEVRFFQAQDQPSVTTHVPVGNRVFFSLARCCFLNAYTHYTQSFFHLHNIRNSI